MLQNIFLVLYAILPVRVRSVALVGIIASFLIEAMFGLAGYLTSNIRNVDFFKLSYNPDLNETGRFQSTVYFAVYSIYGYGKAIFEEYLRKEMKRPIIGPSIMGYGLQLHYHITDVERSQVDLKHMIVLSPIELERYPKDKVQYFNYMKEWDLK